MSQRVNVINQKRVIVEGPNRVRIVRVGSRGVPASVSAASYWTAVAESGLSAENAVATLAPGDHVVAHTDGVPRNATLSDLLAAIGSQNQNLVMASPNGSSGAVSLRALVEADIPSLPASKITSGEFDVARIPNLTLSKITDAGTMASQAANNVAITGGAMAAVAITLGSINNTPIGATTQESGAFTVITSSGDVRFGAAGASAARANVNAGASQIGLIVRANATTPGNLQQWQDSSANILSFVEASGAITAGFRDAGTNNVQTALTLRRNSSATPTNGFGNILAWQLESTTADNTPVAFLNTTWVVATHASRTVRQQFFLSDSGGNREVMRLEVNGTAPMIGFLGAVAVIRQALGAWAGLTTDQKLDTLRDALTNLGLTSYT